MEGAGDTGAVITPELADAVNHVVDVVLGDLVVGDVKLLREEPSLGRASEIEDDLHQFVLARMLA